MTVLEFRGVSHTYQGALRPALAHLDLTLGSGDVVAITGRSGSGKSTALAIAGLLLPPTAGCVAVAGERTDAMGEGGRTRLRRAHVGFLFQEPRLVRHMTVLENVVTPLLATARSVDSSRARELLDEVGLANLADRLPGTLSGGQAQRVALCRALVRRPRLVVADEPTSALDPEASLVIRQLLHRSAAAGVAVLVATHDPTLAGWAARVVSLDARQGAASSPVRKEST